MKQTTSHIIMIAPTNFGFNEEAFLTNKFQQRPLTSEISKLQDLALNEFNTFVEKLKLKGVNVHVINDLDNSQTPDSIFPNNWISTHQTGELILYPMAVSNRRNERRPDIIADLTAKYGFKVFDFTFHETLHPPAYLEGTGSMIFDHQNRTVYAAISPRTNEAVLNEVAQTIGYKPIAFTSLGKTGELIYHTNVMLSIGDSYCIVGLDTIKKNDRERIMETLKASGKELIELTNDQVYNHFAGNMLQIENELGETILVLSQNAFESLNENQINRLTDLNDHIVSAEIPTIERIGGGSARCMMAELFLPII